MTIVIFKKTILLIVLILVMLQPAVALSGDKIIFTSIPEGLDLVIGETVDFNVTLKNGGMYSDVCIQLRNISDGITVSGNNDYKLMDRDSSVTYNLTISADETIESGIYAFEITDSSNYDFRTWTTINLAILNVGDSPVFNIIEEELVDEEPEDEIPTINEVYVGEKTNLTEQKDDSITEDSSDSIMDTAVVLTYTDLSIAVVVEAISITIINLILVAVVGIVRKRKRESSMGISNDGNDNEIVHEDNQDNQDNSLDGGYDNEDNSE